MMEGFASAGMLQYVTRQLHVAGVGLSRVAQGLTKAPGAEKPNTMSAACTQCNVRFLPFGMPVVMPEEHHNRG
jgi:hypothetical protein